MKRFYILLGSNLGHREGYLRQAREQISALSGSPVLTSSIYETAAWGNELLPAFLNQVMVITSQKEPLIILKQLLGIEKQLGRIRGTRWDSRTIDLDILAVDELHYEEPGLKIPHPELENRRFALLPLAEVAPDLQHPVRKKTIRELLNACSDTLPVIRYESSNVG